MRQTEIAEQQDAHSGMQDHRENSEQRRKNSEEFWDHLLTWITSEFTIFSDSIELHSAWYFNHLELLLAEMEYMYIIELSKIATGLTAKSRFVTVGAWCFFCLASGTNRHKAGPRNIMQPPGTKVGRVGTKLLQTWSLPHGAKVATPWYQKVYHMVPKLQPPGTKV